MRTILLLIAGFALSSAAQGREKNFDLKVTVLEVSMEHGTSGSGVWGVSTGKSYTWHRTFVDIDGTKYSITRDYVRHETWLHKGEYSGRWADKNHRKLDIQFEDNGKTRNLVFDVLSEE